MANSQQVCILRMFHSNFLLNTAMKHLCTDEYWKPLVEEIADEIGDQPSIIYVDSKKAAIDLTTSFSRHSSIYRRGHKQE